MKKNFLFLACLFLALSTLSSFSKMAIEPVHTPKQSYKQKSIVSVSVSVTNNTSAKATGNAGTFSYSVSAASSTGGFADYDNTSDGIPLNATLTKIPAGGCWGYWYIDGSSTPTFSYHFTSLTPSVALPMSAYPVLSVSVVFN